MVLQRWVRPAAKSVSLEQSEAEGDGLLGAPDTHIAVPVHDYLEEEAVVDGALSHRQEGRRR
jgi:hypothetical protein